MLKDGTGEIHFSNREIDILKENKKLILTPIFFKKFRLQLMKMCVEFEKAIENDDIKDVKSYDGEEIKTNEV